MTIYTPDHWNVIRIAGPTGEDQPIDKVMGGWSGGYLNGDSWRMNSGITQIREFDDRYEFEGASGSLYLCYKDAEGLRGHASMVLASMTIQAKKRDHTITVISADQAQTWSEEA